MADVSPIDFSDAVEARFWAKVDVRAADECWPWLGHLNMHGYGRMSLFRRRCMPAHRYSFILAGGIVSEDQVIDHICRNRSCCNPTHLRALSRKENVLIGVGPSARNARKTHCVNGHELSGDNLVIRKQGWRACRACLRAGYHLYRKPKLAQAIRGQSNGA